MGQCNNCVRKQEIYKQPPTNRQNFDQIPNKSKNLANKNIKNKQDSLAFPPGSTLNSKSGNPNNEVKIISENDSSQKTRAVQKKKRKVQEQDQLHINKKNLEEKQQKLNQSMINIQLQSQNDKKFTRQIFPQLQKTTQQSNMMQKLSVPQKRKIKSDPPPRYTLYADILKRKTPTNSIPLNRPQPKHLSQFISNDLDLRKTFIPIKNINNKILTNREKKQIGGLTVINQTKNKPQIKTSIVEESNKKFGPKISKISQIQVKNVDSPKENRGQ